MKNLSLAIFNQFKKFTGSVTLANMRLSSIAGMAFVNFSAASVLTANTGRRVKIKDSAGKYILGYILEADAAEGLDSELLSNPGFETAGAGGADIWSSWTELVIDGALANEAVLIHGGAAAAKLTCGATITTGRCRIYVDQAVTAGKLYKVTFWTRGDGTNSGYYALYDQTQSTFISAGFQVSCNVAGTDYAQVTVYFTAPVGCATVRLRLFSPPVNGGICYFDDVSIKNVLHAGATGVHIVSAAGGTTRNWTTQETGFNYNASSGYTYEIFSEDSGELYDAVGGRLYKGRAPEGAEYPYIVYQIVSNAPDKTFNEDYEETLIQFSIFSAAAGSTEIEDLYADLIALFDEKEMTISGETLIWMRRQNAVQMIEDHTVSSQGSNPATVKVWAYHVDYAVTVKI